MNLEFLEIASVALLPHNDENSRIPYRDPRVKPEDDIVGNSRIPKINLEFPKDEFRISRDCFASLAMTQGILDFILQQ